MFYLSNIIKLSTRSLLRNNIYMQTQASYTSKNKNMTKSGYSSKNKLMQRKVDSQYWQKIMNQIQQPAKQLIQQILSPSISKKRITHLINKYLQLRNLTFEIGKRTDKGCLASLVAMNQISHIINLEEYQSRIVDFLSLTDYNLSKQYDGEMLHYFIIALHKRKSNILQKNLRQYYRLKYVQVLHQNFQYIYFKDLYLICEHIMQDINKDSMNFITKIRYSSLVNLIQESLYYKMRQILDKKITPQFQDLMELKNYDNIRKLTELMTVFQFSSQQGAHTFFKFLTYMADNKLQTFPFNYLFIRACSSISSFYFATQNQSLHMKLIKFYQTKYEKSQNIKHFQKKIYPVLKMAFLQKIISDHYARKFRNFPFQVVNNKYKILRKKDLEKPQIDEFMWTLFKKQQEMYLQKAIVNDIIYNLYPDRISKKNIQKPVQVDISSRKIFFIDNQANFRIWQALKNLKYNFKKEQQIAQRMVDLVVEDQILVEVDGEGHNQYTTQQLNQKTCFRNLHLLLRGHKLMVISIYQYNFNRSTKQLQQVIKQKMQLLKQQDVVFVL